MVKLVFISPDFEGQSCEVPEGKTTIGRGADNRLVIQHKSVSGDHCEILVHGGEVILRDHDSSNGLWIDGARIQGQSPACHGQRIRFGAVEARLEIQLMPFVDENSDISAVQSHVRVVRETTCANEPSHGSPASVIIKPNSGLREFSA